MQLDRRSFTASLMATAGLASTGLAAETAGLFWTATASGKSPCILFGYARTAASVTQDIVADGDRYAAASRHLVGDTPNVRFPTVSIPRDTLQPILGRVSAKTADRLRGVLDKSFAALPMKEKVTGVEMVLILRGEGRTPPQPSVGGTIAEHAQVAASRSRIW